jgi:hypothetical protein
MKILPSSKDERIALALFPFKAYVVMALPFLDICRWCKATYLPRFYGYPEEATWDVSTGYELCLMALLLGALVQAIRGPRWSLARTVAFLVLGFVIYERLYPWGMLRR